MDYLSVYKNIFTKQPNYNNQEKYSIRYNYIIEFIKEKQCKNVIDISCGNGNLLELLKENFTDLNITATDLDKFFTDDTVKFIKMDLTNVNDYQNLTGHTFDVLCCLDVLEHLEIQNIPQVLKFLSSLSEYYCFNIANHSDVNNGIELHLTQKDKDWWNAQLSLYFTTIKTFNLFNNRLYCYILKKK